MASTDIRPAESTDAVVDEPPRNTSKATLPASCVLKRSVYNRTKLFVPEAETYDELRCSSSITQYVNRDSRFHSLAALNSRTASDYARTALHCWHDTCAFDGPVVPLPKSYDSAQKCFVVYGCFCSLSCAKAHLCERSTFDTGMQLVLLERMAKEVYGVGNVIAAPPRLSLDRFGGPYSLERFRGMTPRHEVTLVAPPFVSTYMVCEEQETVKVSALGVNGISSVRGLRRPAEPIDMGSQEIPDKSPYLEFLAARGGGGGGGGGVAATAAGTSHRHEEKPTSAPPKRQVASTRGTLARFMKD